MSRRFELQTKRACHYGASWMDEMEDGLPDAVEYCPALHIVQLAELIEPVCDA